MNEAEGLRCIAIAFAMDPRTKAELIRAAERIEKLEAIINRAGALALQKASHSHILDTLSQSGLGTHK